MLARTLFSLLDTVLSGDWLRGNTELTNPTQQLSRRLATRDWNYVHATGQERSVTSTHPGYQSLLSQVCRVVLLKAVTVQTRSDRDCLPAAQGTGPAEEGKVCRNV